MIPTSFPAIAAAASALGYLARRGCLQTCGGAGALSHHLLAGARQGATACSGGGGPPITTPGRAAISQHLGHLPSDLAVTAALVLRVTPYESAASSF